MSAPRDLTTRLLEVLDKHGWSPDDIELALDCARVGAEHELKRWAHIWCALGKCTSAECRAEVK